MSEQDKKPANPERSLRDISALTEALLKCESVKNRNSRNKIVDNLPNRIRQTISREEDDRRDVAGIVNSCLDHDEGLVSLISIVRYFEGNTIWMRKVTSLLKNFLNPDERIGRLFISSKRAPWIDQAHRELFHEMETPEHKSEDE